MTPRESRFGPRPMLIRDCYSLVTARRITAARGASKSLARQGAAREGHDLAAHAGKLVLDGKAGTLLVERRPMTIDEVAPDAPAVGIGQVRVVEMHGRRAERPRREPLGAGRQMQGEILGAADE